MKYIYAVKGMFTHVHHLHHRLLIQMIIVEGVRCVEGKVGEQGIKRLFIIWVQPIVENVMDISPILIAMINAHLVREEGM